MHAKLAREVLAVWVVIRILSTYNWRLFVDFMLKQSEKRYSKINLNMIFQHNQYWLTFIKMKAYCRCPLLQNFIEKLHSTTNSLGEVQITQMLLSDLFMRVVEYIHASILQLLFSKGLTCIICNKYRIIYSNNTYWYILGFS